MRTENKIKIICAIVAIVFADFVAGNIFLGLFTKYLQSPAREDDYVEAVSDDGVWKVYLIPDWFGFVRGYIIPQTEETPDKIKVLSKEGDYSNFLSTNEKLDALAKADAEAIIESIR